MPTVSDFLKAAETVAAFNLIIFFAGWAMLRSMKRKGQVRRAFHGWYVWMWMMGGVMIGGLFAPWQDRMYQWGPVLTGFLCGWGGGALNGFLALRRVGEPPPEQPKED